MINRPRYGEKWAGIGALALLGFLFLDWFGGAGIGGVYVDRAAGDGKELGFTAYSRVSEGLSGWHALAWPALALCLLTIAAGLILPVVFSLYESPVLPLLAAIACLTLGGLTVMALLVQVVFQPGDDASTSVLGGWWLGLLAALAVSRGGYLSMHDEWLPDATLPDVPVRPAPAA